MNAEIPQLNPENLKLENSETVREWGKTLVFAPHPDDESLGCGGVIALLRKFEVPVSVVTVSDGTLSHPNSRKFPPDKLRAVREREMVAALKILGVETKNIFFLRYPDRSVPNHESAEFYLAVEKVKEIFDSEKPQTVVVPWRRDPHPDHQATWQIVSAVIATTNAKIKFVEYPIWLWEMAEENDLPTENIRAWRLNIADVVSQKQEAIHAHVSQTTDLIDDDPQGFRLSAEVLAHFAVPYEVFLEEIK